MLASSSSEPEYGSRAKDAERRKPLGVQLKCFRVKGAAVPRKINNLKGERMSKAKSKANPHREPIPLTARVWVTGALADKFPSLALVAPKYLKAGDLKLWCHKFQKATVVGSGMFRAAVYDGKNWRTFRLNVIADEDARYGDYNDWTRKAGRVIDALRQQKDRPAHWKDNTYGVLFTRQATPPPPVGEAQPRKVAGETPTAVKEAPVTTPVSEAVGAGVNSGERILAVVVVVEKSVAVAPSGTDETTAPGTAGTSAPVQDAARQATVPATACDTAGKGSTALVKPAPKRRRKRHVDPNQLTLGFGGGEQASV